jgi:hypothetical protein
MLVREIGKQLCQVDKYSTCRNERLARRRCRSPTCKERRIDLPAVALIWQIGQRERNCALKQVAYNLAIDCRIAPLALADQDRSLRLVDRHNMCLNLPAPVAADDLGGEGQRTSGAALANPLPCKIFPGGLPDKRAQSALECRQARS